MVCHANCFSILLSVDHSIIHEWKRIETQEAGSGGWACKGVFWFNIS